jgi:hypothetical protein
VQYAPLEPEDFDALAVFQCDVAAGNILQCRAEHARATGLLQFSHAPDMVGVMVGHQDVGESPARVLRQPLQDWRGIARIDHGAALLAGIL